MSISVNTNTTAQMQSLANELAKAVDGNKDGQISTSEFGTFILNLLQGNLGKASTSPSASLASAAGLTTSGTKTLLPGVARLATTEEIALVKGMRADEAVAALSDEPPLGFMPEFLGFEGDRLESARTSLKYDAFHVLNVQLTDSIEVLGYSATPGREGEIEASVLSLRIVPPGAER